MHLGVITLPFLAAVGCQTVAFKALETKNSRLETAPNAWLESAL